MSKPSPNCRRCPRLVTLRCRVRRAYPDYHAAPVQAFGPADARLLIVGLAPGMHGANATGRPFTGDQAGRLLYQTLYDFGFCSTADARAGHPGLVLYDCRITNAVKCLPPNNKPVASEIDNCNGFLKDELKRAQVLVALGGLAHKAVVKALGQRPTDTPFAHGAQHRLADGRVLFDSYHCSRYNTQTKRLTAAMFAVVFAKVAARLRRAGLPVAQSTPF